MRLQGSAVEPHTHNNACRVRQRETNKKVDEIGRREIPNSKLYNAEELVLENSQKVNLAGKRHTS